MDRHHDEEMPNRDNDATHFERLRKKQETVAESDSMNLGKIGGE